jgi:hypothetical protein
MLGITKPIARLSRITGPMPLAIGSTPWARCRMKAAPIRPNTPPDAPTVAVVGEESSSAPNEPASTEVKYSARNRARPSAGSSIVPSQYRTYMLKRMCRIPECRKAEVTSRHHCPSATATPTSAPSWNTRPPPPPPPSELPAAEAPMNTSTLMAMST